MTNGADVKGGEGMVELKRCPFCGGNPKIWYDGNLVPYGVLCKCGAAVKFRGISERRGDTFGDIQERIAERYNRRGGE